MVTPVAEPPVSEIGTDAELAQGAVAPSVPPAKSICGDTLPRPYTMPPAPTYNWPPVRFKTAVPPPPLWPKVIKGTFAKPARTRNSESPVRGPPSTTPLTVSETTRLPPLTSKTDQRPPLFSPMLIEPLTLTVPPSMRTDALELVFALVVPTLIAPAT